MKKAILTLFLSLFVAGFGNGVDLRRAPTSADRAKILADGWVASRDSLGSALVAAYQPGGPLRPGSTGVTAYRGWMSFWKWCDLLSRNERKEAARLLADHFRVSREDEKLSVFAPGYVSELRQ